MNEIKRILQAIQDDGIDPMELSQIREIHRMLGMLLDSVESEYGLGAGTAAAALAFLERLKESGETSVA